MLKSYIHKATMEDLGRVAALTRQADRDEAEAMTGKPFLESLVRSYRCSSHVWVGYADIMPVCLFGVAPINSFAGTAAPWMVGTHAIEDKAIARRFARENGSYVEIMLSLYSHLQNYVDQRNEQAIRWLTWLGFEINDDAVAFGASKLPFYYFEKKVSVNV